MRRAWSAVPEHRACEGEWEDASFFQKSRGVRLRRVDADADAVRNHDQSRADCWCPYSEQLFFLFS